MKSSAVLNSRQERTAGSTSHFGSSKAVSGSSALLVGGSSCVVMPAPLTDTANHMALEIEAIRSAPDTRPAKLQTLGLVGQSRIIVQAPSRPLQHNHHHSRGSLRRDQGCQLPQPTAPNASIL